MIIKRLIVASSLATLSTSCVTGSAIQDKTIKVDAVYVHKTTGQDIISPSDRSQWVNLRKSTSSEQAKLYSSLGAREWTIAIADARKYLLSHPNDLVGLHVLSIGLVMNKQYSLANYYAKILETHYPNQTDSLNLQGLALMNRPGATYEDFSLAQSLFERDFEENVKSIASGLNLGHLHLHTGNAESARDVFTAVRDRCGNCEAALEGSGFAAARLKDFKAAKEYFEKAMDLNDKNMKAKYYGAVVEASGFKNYDDAISLLEDILKGDQEGNEDLIRQANFLMRRLEVQIKMSETPRPASQNQLVDKPEPSQMNQLDSGNDINEIEPVTEKDLQDVEGAIPVSDEASFTP